MWFICDVTQLKDDKIGTGSGFTPPLCLLYLQYDIKKKKKAGEVGVCCQLMEMVLYFSTVRDW